MLMQQARAAYLEAGEGSGLELSEAEQWLKERGLPLQ
jgi:hypothetical protein